MSGFEIKKPEIVETEKEIATDLVNEVENRDLRIKHVTASIIEQVQKGKRIKITDEMRELGIVDQVIATAYRHHALRKLGKLFGNDSDDDGPTSLELLDRSLL